MSGYFKLLDGQDEFARIARHGPSYHENEGCDAYGYYGMLSVEGDAFFKKKTYHHGGGYTERTAVAENVVSELQDRWIGIKFMIYDVGKGHVKLELWIDDGDETNNWKKVTEYIDDGGWETDESHCDRPKDYIIDSGTRATFRVDDSEFEFKKLSVKYRQEKQRSCRIQSRYYRRTTNFLGLWNFFFRICIARELYEN